MSAHNFAILIVALFVLGYAQDGLDMCSGGQGCWDCLNKAGCVWCLQYSNCTKAENCRFTGYTDCCATMKTCSECVAQPKCGFCEDQQRCTPGAANGTLYPGNGCSGENDYYYDRCPDTSVPAATIIFGIVLALGCGVVITGMTLLGLYFRQLYAKNSARAQLERYYLKVRPVCAFCADFYAVVQCNTCHGQFCKTCADLHAQELEDHISTPINMYDSVKRYTSFPEEQ